MLCIENTRSLSKRYGQRPYYALMATVITLRTPQNNTCEEMIGIFSFEQIRIDKNPISQVNRFDFGNNYPTAVTGCTTDESAD